MGRAGAEPCRASAQARQGASADLAARQQEISALVEPVKHTLEKLDKGDGKESPEFYKAKIQTAEFYFEHLLPRAQAHARSALAGPHALMQMRNDQFFLS